MVYFEWFIFMLPMPNFEIDANVTLDLTLSGQADFYIGRIMVSVSFLMMCDICLWQVYRPTLNWRFCYPLPQNILGSLVLELKTAMDMSKKLVDLDLS